MPFIEWHPNFELGIVEFDEHHKHLLHLLNSTFDGVTEGVSHKELEAVLDDLISYATYHFAAEENWMDVHKYPGLSEHREEHERFYKRVVEIQIDFHNGKTDLGVEIMQFLSAWLTDHILNTDADYGHFAQESSIEFR